jgi:hypothetical protein
MSKRKRVRSIKARSAPKSRSKAATRKSAAAHHRMRANSKQARVLELLRRPTRFGWRRRALKFFLDAGATNLN